MANQKNYSDELFEKYLISQNLKFDYEKDCEIREKQGKRTPDYTIYDDSQDLIIDVKEFENRGFIDGQFRFSSIDDELNPIRQKINSVAGQFKDYKDKSCSLVLYSYDFFIAHTLLNPNLVYGAMLGNIGWRIPIRTNLNENQNSSENIQATFFEKGKMLNQGRRQNRTISALMSLCHYTNEYNEIDGIAVIIFENPFAKIPLPRTIFCGDYDVRFGKNGYKIEQLYVGKGIRKNPEQYQNFFIQFD